MITVAEEDCGRKPAQGCIALVHGGDHNASDWPCLFAGRVIAESHSRVTRGAGIMTYLMTYVSNPWNSFPLPLPSTPIPSPPLPFNGAPRPGGLSPVAPARVELPVRKKEDAEA